jgi:alkanesulfonate monooxygenase SsuD/methylene tetrahydromethanopterin reductase-like flavin-dependent oxidoreductase (luciferase family)
MSPIRLRFDIVILPEDRWSVTRERWRAAEDYGFDHVWTDDHLSWRMFRDEAWFGAIPTLTAAALATSRIRIGTLVVHWPRANEPFTGDRSVLERIAADVLQPSAMATG